MNLIEKLKERLDQADVWDRSLDLKRKEYLKVKGSTDTNLYYIEEGSLRVYIEDEFEEHTIRLGYRDNFLSALDSFISESPSEFYIQAIKRSTVRVLSKHSFMQFVQSNPDNFRLWHALMEQVVFQQLEREKDILTHSPRDRYERVLRRSPALFQEIPAKYIASYLRMSPETLSRLKKS